MVQAFSSIEKGKVRQSDLYLIAELSKKANRQLTYLGLPSPWMADISNWLPHLNKVFAVEQEKKLIPHLMDKAYSLGLINKFAYFWGNIDLILKTRIDQFGHSIEEIFPIDLINLDYCHGLDYQGFQKLSTLECIFNLQRDILIEKTKKINFPYFLILLTHNIPSNEGNPKAKKDYIELLTQDATHYEESLKKQIYRAKEWYLSEACPPAYQHKCFVIGKSIEWAHLKGFKVVPKAITQYYGDKEAVMLHYQFQVTPVSLGSPVPAKNKITLMDILNFPVLNCESKDIASNRPLIQV